MALLLKCAGFKQVRAPLAFIARMTHDWLASLEIFADGWTALHINETKPEQLFSWWVWRIYSSRSSPCFTPSLWGNSTPDWWKTHVMFHTCIPGDWASAEPGSSNGQKTSWSLLIFSGENAHFSVLPCPLKLSCMVGEQSGDGIVLTAWQTLILHLHVLPVASPQRSSATSTTWSSPNCLRSGQAVENCL